jgi:hypothetical protein
VNSADLTHLQGASVLVKSTFDHRNPPTALRGTIDARPGDHGPAQVKIILEYPDMFNSVAHQGIIELDPPAVERLIATERDGVYEFTVNDPLEPGPNPGGPQAVS